MVTAEQTDAFRTNGIGRVDDLLTDAELDTFEPLLTPADAYPLGQRRAHTRGRRRGREPSSPRGHPCRG